MFITFEGGEGTGKTTQIKLLSNELNTKGIKHIITREPGGTEQGEQIRTLLMNGDIDYWLPETETLLLFAARLEHYKRVIKPAMDIQEWVLCDRFIDSTYVYQGYGKGVSFELIHLLHEKFLSNVIPDITFILDSGPERSQKLDRFELLDSLFHQNIRQGFLNLSKTSQRFNVIDSNKSIDEVFKVICKTILKIH